MVSYNKQGAMVIKEPWPNAFDVNVPLGPLRTQVKGHDHVFVTALETHPKVVPTIKLAWLAGFRVKPTSWRWA